MAERRKRGPAKTQTDSAKKRRKISNADIQYNEFGKAIDGSVNIEFSSVMVATGARSKLHCASLCDQHSWCLAISWDNNNHECQELSRTLTPEATPSYTTTYTALYIGQGYTYIAGTLVKFFRNSGRFSWQGAQDYCGNEGGRLLVIDTLEKYNAVKTYNALSGLWWVGATEVSSTWTWTTGQAMDSSIPIVIDSTYTCLSFYFGDLNDSKCTWEAYFICEK
ncbi:C-type lectin domain family 7 member A-like [Pecten maximus]|uniref:C-type lectin domain family 7 member A-like n=1 Tax=Pecten maximus TaxID=6579 RepID=UPI001458FD98|nr:C-type lectin domain family 7 member A-like [Pecten maximus]